MGTWKLTVVGLAAMTAAACGGGGHGRDGIASADGSGAGAAARGSTTTSIPADEAMLQFTRCMREHGIDLPDPDENGSVLLAPDDGDIDVHNDEFREAERACMEFLPSRDGVSEEDAAQMEDKLRALAECMRDHGFDIPDPVIVRPGDQAPGDIPDDPPDIDFDDPEFRAAERECSEEVDLGIPGGGPGDPGGPGDREDEQ